MLTWISAASEYDGVGESFLAITNRRQTTCMSLLMCSFSSPSRFFDDLGSCRLPMLYFVAWSCWCWGFHLRASVADVTLVTANFVVFHCTGAVVVGSLVAFHMLSASGTNMLSMVFLLVSYVLHGLVRGVVGYSSISVSVYDLLCGHFCLFHIIITCYRISVLNPGFMRVGCLVSAKKDAKVCRSGSWP